MPLAVIPLEVIDLSVSAFMELAFHYTLSYYWEGVSGIISFKPGELEFELHPFTPFSFFWLNLESRLRGDLI